MLDFPEGYVLHQHSWHFCRRFYERIGRPLAFGEYSNIISKIENGRALFIKTNKNNPERTEYCVRIKNPNGKDRDKIYVIFDRNKKLLISVAYPKRNGKRKPHLFSHATT